MLSYPLKQTTRAIHHALRLTADSPPMLLLLSM